MRPRARAREQIRSIERSNERGGISIMDGRKGIRLRFDHRWTSHAVPFPKHSPLLPLFPHLARRSPESCGSKLLVSATHSAVVAVGMGAPVAGQVCALLRSQGEAACALATSNERIWRGERRRERERGRLGIRGLLRGITAVGLMDGSITV